jgi:hypothetical protein
MGRINTFYNNVYHRDIGTIESYEMACQEFPKIASKNNSVAAKILG